MLIQKCLLNLVQNVSHHKKMFKLKNVGTNVMFVFGNGFNYYFLWAFVSEV
jgi:hypothetical protein